jgi:1-acyl-sn-glycerol-3-phosphate acyltransferase
MSLARAAWEYLVLGLGFAILGLVTFAWALVSLPLLVLLPAGLGRRTGRVAAMYVFRGYLATLEALGAWRLDLRSLDALREAGPLIIAPNHPCLLDAVLVVSRLPNAVCVMKSALLGNIFFGPAARLARYVRNDSLLRLVTRAGDEVRQGGQLLLFPEGTRTRGAPIGPLTEAVGALSRRLGVPVQAVVIEADSDFLGKGRSLLARPRMPLHYRVRLGRRFDPPEDVRAFTVELSRHLARELAAREPMALPDADAVEEAQRLRG